MTDSNTNSNSNQ